MSVIGDHESVPLPPVCEPEDLPTLAEIYRQDPTGKVPPILLETHPEEIALDEVPVAQYTSSAFHDLEVEKVWKRVWQMACLEQEIPNVGDHLLYEIADISIIVVRSHPDTISAFYNSCLHRGTTLATGEGNCQEFRCPFHGWCFDLDGVLTDVPAKSDFPNVKLGERIPEVKVETWDGWVFVNFDPRARPLREYLGILPDHMAYWPWKNRHVAGHVAKIIPCNWKVAADAFLESYHVPYTHPQLTYLSRSYAAQYDIYGPHVSRMLEAMAAPNPFTGPDVSEQELADYFLENFGQERVIVPEGMTARSFIASMMREQLGNFWGAFKLTDASDVEVLDAPEYFLFPNFVLWGGFGLPVAYRYRPNGNDPHSCIKELFIMNPVAAGEPIPPPAKIHWLGADEKFADAPELAAIGAAYDQDLANLPRIQKGLRATPMTTVKLSQHQESQIRNFHRTLGRYVDAQ